MIAYTHFPETLLINMTNFAYLYNFRETKIRSGLESCKQYAFRINYSKKVLPNRCGYKNSKKVSI